MFELHVVTLSQWERFFQHSICYRSSCRRHRDRLQARLLEGQRRVLADGRAPADRHRLQDAAVPAPEHHGGGGGQRLAAPPLRPDGERAHQLHLPAQQLGSVAEVKGQSLGGHSLSTFH